VLYITCQKNIFFNRFFFFLQGNLICSNPLLVISVNFKKFFVKDKLLKLIPSSSSTLVSLRKNLKGNKIFVGLVLFVWFFKLYSLK